MLTWRSISAAVLGATLALTAGVTGVAVAGPISAVGPVPGAPADLVDPDTRTGATAETAAASCFEIKQLHPASDDGSYWLLTPQLTGPEQFWCDMSTDGGGWVRIGSGREQWSTVYDGKGDADELRLAQPPLTRAVQLPSKTVDALLDGGRVDELSDGVRVKRATDAAGASWQEVRFGYTLRDRWVWTLGAEHRVADYDIGGTTGSGGQTNNFGSGSSTSRVDTRTQSSQGFRWGFAYGSAVTGVNSAATYLWSRTDGQGSALPYAEVYLRPRLMSQDLIFEPVPDSGTEAIEQTAAAEDAAQVNPWGVTGTAGSTATEGNVEVQAFEQIGNVMFVGGNFGYVQRDSAGAGRVERPFLAAFNAVTGEYIPGFTPTFNEQVRALRALPNGDLAVGGDFTEANGKPVQGLVALDATTGSTDPSWAVTIENGINPGVVRVESLDISGNYLYVGGSFTHLSRADGSGRLYSRNAGRVSVTSGDPNRWNPEFNGTVLDVATSEDGARTYFSGFFSSSRQQPAFRTAAVMNDGDGTLDPTPWTPTWSNPNKNYQRTIDQLGDSVWVGGSEHSLFEFSTQTYDRVAGSITKKHGDIQTMDAEGGLLYAGCHCNDWVYQDAYSWSNVGTGWTQADAIGWFGLWDTATGDYVPDFVPTFSTRLGSGIWAIEIADDGTVWAGGDITSGLTTSGGRWLGGFARWAPRDTAAPSAPSNLRAAAQSSSTVSLAWDAATGGASGYQILRDDRVIATTNGGRSATVPKGGENRFFVRAVDSVGNVSASTQVLTTGDGNPAPTPVIDYDAAGLSIDFDGSRSTDDGTIERYLWDFGDGTTGEGARVSHSYEVSGTYTVQLTVVDDLGSHRMAQVDVVAEIPAPTDAYGSAVYEDDPYLYWRLGDESGPVMQDYSGNDRPGTVNGTIGRGVAGALVDNPDLAADFDGSSGHVVGQPGTQVSNPTTFSVESWFNTTSARGGKLIGFGNQPSGLSSSYDRHVYLQDDGTLSFGVWTGQTNVVSSDPGFNDGKWHHVVATLGNDGMKLYVDGTLVGTNPQTAAQDYTGYWRVGGDRTWGGASSSYLDGVIDEAAVYTSVLTAEQVGQHYTVGTAQTPNQEPVAEFLVDATELAVSLDATGSADADGDIVSYEWDFGDGASATGVSVGHTYAADGTYTVMLTVTDDRGATGSTTQEVTVAQIPNAEPVAEFTAEISGLDVSLSAAGSADADGDIVSYEWDFGDGASATGVSAAHTYAAEGTYTVTLTVTDDQGATGVSTQDLTVGVSGEPVTGTVIERDASWSWYYEAPAPQSDWQTNGADVSAWEAGPAPLGFGFSGVATDIDIAGPTSDRPRAAYFVREFEVADASRVVSLQLDTVANDGVVVYVNGTEVSRHNMRDGDVTHDTFAPTARNITTANTDPVVVDVPVGLLVDGTNVVTAETHLNYRGTRDVSFELDAELTTVPGGTEPNRAPRAAFEIQADLLDVAVDGSPATDADGDALAYAWDFGDGASATGITAEHSYAADGTYPVALTVTDPSGAEDTVTHDVTVTAVGEPVTTTAIERDTAWSWYYAAPQPPADWRQVGADVSAWESGSAPLGFGYAGIVTDIDIDGPTSDRPRAAYFVHELEIPEAKRVQSLVLDTVANDGVVVYVNGTEVARHNMPSGTITHGTFASVGRWWGTALKDPVVIDVPVSLLVDGTNVVTAQTHLGYRSTKDVSFELDAEITTQ